MGSGSSSRMATSWSRSTSDSGSKRRISWCHRRNHSPAIEFAHRTGELAERSRTSWTSPVRTSRIVIPSPGRTATTSCTERSTSLLGQGPFVVGQQVAAQHELTEGPALEQHHVEGQRVAVEGPLRASGLSAYAARSRAQASASEPNSPSITSVVAFW